MNPQNDQHKNDKQGGLSWTQPAQKPSSASGDAKAPRASDKMEAKAPSSGAAQSNVAKITGWLAAGIVAGVVIAWGATAAFKNSGTAATSTAQNTSNSTSTTTSLGQGSDPSLTVMSPQKAGSSVSIAKAIVSDATWVVVYESRDGKPGNVLGAALFFPDRQSGSVELLRGTSANQTYFVTKHADDGDHKFSLRSDPMLTENGQAMWVSFTAN